MPNNFPPIQVEVRKKGKKVSKNFKPTRNTSVFAHAIFDLLEKSDDKRAIVRIGHPKVSRLEAIRKILPSPPTPTRGEVVKEKFREETPTSKETKSINK